MQYIRTPKEQLATLSKVLTHNIPRPAPPGWSTLSIPPRSQASTCRTLRGHYTTNLEGWHRALSSHTDQTFAHYIIEGLCQGFRIGFNRSSPLRSAANNMGSALQHPEVISEYLQKEKAPGRLLGPFGRECSFPELHINRFGVIPKGHTSGKWRLITDLSYPPGLSINDGIDPLICSLSYTTVDAVAEVATSLGQHTLLAKVDTESAFRLIPVHPQDRALQAVKWEGEICSHSGYDRSQRFSMRWQTLSTGISTNAAFYTSSITSMILSLCPHPTPAMSSGHPDPEPGLQGTWGAHC